MQAVDEARLGRSVWWSRDRFGMSIRWEEYTFSVRDEWVRSVERMIARDYQYAILTATHHDGYALFESVSSLPDGQGIRGSSQIEV